MAGELKIKQGTRLRMAYDAPIGKEPDFSLTCTFYKALDESAFLVSIPMVGGKPLKISETQKLLIQYGDSTEQQILAGYVDDEVKEGIRRYWKIRRVAEQRQFFQRVDVRLKVSLPVTYMQDTWPVNVDGVIDPEEGLTMDISNNGLAVYTNRWFEVGDVVFYNLPKIGTVENGDGIHDLVGTICWMREAPKGSAYRFLSGVQLRFGKATERKQMMDYVATVKKRYKL